jgi:hypothetical protein
MNIHPYLSSIFSLDFSFVFALLLYLMSTVNKRVWRKQSIHIYNFIVCFLDYGFLITFWYLHTFQYSGKEIFWLQKKINTNISKRKHTGG